MEAGDSAPEQDRSASGGHEHPPLAPPVFPLDVYTASLDALLLQLLRTSHLFVTLIHAQELTTLKTAG